MTITDTATRDRASWEPNAEQQAAVEAKGQVFVSAGAGTGKTRVLVERFAQAVCDDGVDVSSILVITYTDRAAGELRSRIRQELLDRGRDELARELDGAWISTVHGFCQRLLKAYPFAAGIDPGFRVLDESQGRVLRSEAFTSALAEFCFAADDDVQPDEPDSRSTLLATYGAKGLRRMLTGIYETLRSAGRPLELTLGESTSLEDRCDEVRSAAAECLAGNLGSEAQRTSVARLVELLDSSPGPESLLDLRGFAVKGRGKEHFEAYEDARQRLQQAALDVLAARDRKLLQSLLVCFARAYAEAKARESVLDFEDLQLLARDLLCDETIRERESWRFRAVLVDEFQDTNRLQCELIDLIAGDDVFYVGDEFQSIYAFRHADIDVFRERRGEAANVLALTQNYRSRPEVLAAVNYLFAGDFGDEFQPLAAAGDFPDPVFGVPVELLVTDKSSYEDTGMHWRRAEARHIARRLRQLVDSGAATAGEIVVLFAAGTDAETYEQALRQEGLPTYRAVGRGYFGQQQVVDLLAYLRLLHNRYDDEALVSVLASPLVGVSNDALMLLRQAAGRRPLFAGLERGMPPDVGSRDERLLMAFRQRHERLSKLAGRTSLERLCEEIVAAHDYDLAVLSRWDGRRRYANLRKLGRLARSYEALRGPDIEGFVRFVRDQDATGARELEAVAIEEGADAVRLLTIHAAKGLEFKVVVVADAGREKMRPGPDEILCLPDGRFGLRVADPVTGKRRPAFGYDEVKDARGSADEAERRRLYYVAMTRAQDRLIVSGAIDPESSADASTPIGWVLARLGEDVLGAAGDDPLELEREGARLLVRVDRHRPEVEPAASGGLTAEQLELFGQNGGEAPRELLGLPPLEPLPEPPRHRIRRLSYSALALYERCSYRFYAERIVGMRPVDAAGGIPGQTGLAATEIGDAVHHLLEHVDLHSPAPPAAEELEQAVLARYPGANAEELGRIRSLLEAYCSSPLARRLAATPAARPERPFAFEHDGVLLHGRLDVLALDSGRALVVDYKTNVLDESTPAEVVEQDYRLQRLVYALACFRAGANEVEVAYQFLERPDDVVSTTFTRADVESLEAELSEAIAAIHEGEFAPTPSEFACAGCPALDVVCAGPRLLGAAPSPPDERLVPVG